MAYATLETMSEAISEHFSKTDMPEAIKAWKAKDGYHFHPIELPSTVTEIHMTLGDDGFYHRPDGERNIGAIHFVNDFRIVQMHDSNIITPGYIRCSLMNLDDPELIDPSEAIIFGCVVITWDKDESQGELEDSLSWATVYTTVEV